MKLDDDTDSTPWYEVHARPIGFIAIAVYALVAAGIWMWTTRDVESTVGVGPGAVQLFGFLLSIMPFWYGVTRVMNPSWAVTFTTYDRSDGTTADGNRVSVWRETGTATMQPNRRYGIKMLFLAFFIYGGMTTMSNWVA